MPVEWISQGAYFYRKYLQILVVQFVTQFRVLKLYPFVLPFFHMWMLCHHDICFLYTIFCLNKDGGCKRYCLWTGIHLNWIYTWLVTGCSMVAIDAERCTVKISYLLRSLWEGWINVLTIQYYHTRALSGGASGAWRGLIWAGSDVTVFTHIVAHDICPIGCLKTCIMADTTRSCQEKPTIWYLYFCLIYIFAFNIILLL